MSFPHVSHIQIPFDMSFSWSGVASSTIRLAGRWYEAAIIWQAVPVKLVDAAVSSLGPTVGASQPGKEQKYPARLASFSLVAGVKSAGLLNFLPTY